MDPQTFFGHFRESLPKSNRLAATALWQLISSAYTHPHRLYHDWFHIRTLFELADQYQPLIKNAALFRWSILLHDVVYDPGNPDNERMCASLWDVFGQDLMFSKAEIAAGRQLVLATIHPTVGFNLEEQLLSDLDLYGLAASEAEFDIVSSEVWLEFEAAGVDRGVFRAGAIEFWQRMLTTPIYQVPQIHDAREAAARANIERYIERLRLE